MKLIAALLLACSAAYAGPVENMVNQCQQVMEQGACRVSLDARNYPNPTISIIGVGRISTAAYLRIRNTGDALAPDGRFLMCTTVEDVCSANFNGDECKAARALWRQSP
jgi:hypothetical protein